MRTHQGGVVSAPIPADEIAAITNELAVYMQHKNHRNPLRETKTQRDIQKDYLNHVGAFAVHEDQDVRWDNV